MTDKKAGIPETITTDYIKSNFFRVIHADGVFGGITPRGQVHIDVFSERKPIPTRMVYSVNEDETLGPENRELRGQRATDLVREVECGIVMDAELVRAMIVFLEGRLKDLEKLKQVTSE